MSDARQPEVSFFSLLICLDAIDLYSKCLYSCRDDLPKSLFKITAQVYKKSTLFDARLSRTSLLKLPVDYFESYIERFSYDLEKWFR